MNSSSARRKPGEAGIDLEKIVKVATRIGEREGFGALSMRRLAAELHVGVMSLYRYVRTKQELLDRIVDRYLSRLDLSPVDGPLDEQVVSVLRALHELMIAEPVLAQALIAPIDSPGVYRFAEAVLRPMREAGFGNSEAVNLFRQLHSYTLGFTLHQIAHANTPNRTTETRKASLQQLSKSDFPNLLAMSSEWGDWESVDLFEDGLRRILVNPNSLATNRSPSRTSRPKGIKTQRKV